MLSRNRPSLIDSSPLSSTLIVITPSLFSTLQLESSHSNFLSLLYLYINEYSFYIMILRVTHSAPLWGFQNSNFSHAKRRVVLCGLRSTYKAPRRTRVLSKETIHVIHALKLARSPDHVLDAKLSRLLKADILNLLEEFQRQNQLHLSLRVFRVVCQEHQLGHDTLLQLYADIILLLGRNNETRMAEEVFCQVVEKGFKPDTRICTEMIGVYLQVGMTEKAMEMYESMKEWGCSPDKFTFTVLITNLQKTGQQDLVEKLKQDSLHYLESPDKFLRQLQQKKPAKKRHVDLV